jgi:hypothetical protein
MPNVLILPRSADYSEEVWMEIREKAITIVQSYILDGVMPSNTVSEEEEEEEEEVDEAIFEIENDPLDKRMKEDPLLFRPSEESMDHQLLQTDDSQLSSEYDKQRGISQLKEPHSAPSGSRSEGRRSGSRRKGM